MKKILILFLLVTLYHHAVSQANSDLSNYSKGFTNTFRSKGHSKAKGLDISIKYLKDWKAEEGSRPNVVQRFSKMVQGANVNYNIVIKQIPGGSPSLADKNDILSDLCTEEATPGSTLISHNSDLVIDGERAAMCEYKIIRTSEQTAVGLPMTFYSLIYSIIYKNYSISVTFGVGGESSQVDIYKTYEAYKPLFRLIMSNFVINSKWN